MKTIKRALFSVYYKKGIEQILRLLHKHQVEIIASGGTFQYIKGLGIPAIEVAELTDYPSILGGRVKTLHPKIFGGILGRSNEDQEEMAQYNIKTIDLVIVDLYPFEETLAKKQDESKIIEKIDIGGVSLIRAAAKNFHDVMVVPAAEHYPALEEILRKNACQTNLEERRLFAAYAFKKTKEYDEAISGWFLNKTFEKKELRYGENPHQKAFFFGNLEEVFTQLHGKDISYNNLLDLEAGIQLIHDFDQCSFAILKHNNACGMSSRDSVLEAYRHALAGDPISAFGGVLICNRAVDEETAEEINKLFFEIIWAPSYQAEALEILKSKKNRIILKGHAFIPSSLQHRSMLNGYLQQERDSKTENQEDLKTVSRKHPSPREIEDLIFANKLVKHTKSNAIVLAKNKQLLASGVGQTSRIDALKQAIAKAKHFNFELEGAVMASDAFFPFADSVEIAHEVGIRSVIQPGGSVRDQESIDFCDQHDMTMVFTGIRHFKH